MVETYPVDIQVMDLSDMLAKYLAEHGFEETALEKLHPLDKNYLEKRDQRKITGAVELTTNQKWRSADDYLIFEHSEGTLAYIRPSPFSPAIYHALPFEIHFRTAAPLGFSIDQYFSLAIPQRNLNLMLENLKKRGYNSISAIVDMSKINILRGKLSKQLDEVEENRLPVHVFHSTYVSRTREEKGGYSDNDRAIDDLSKAVSSVIVAAHLFSRKQMEYYKAAAGVDELFLDSALI